MDGLVTSSFTFCLELFQRTAAFASPLSSVSDAAPGPIFNLHGKVSDLAFSMISYDFRISAGTPADLEGLQRYEVPF